MHIYQQLPVEHAVQSSVTLLRFGGVNKNEAIMTLIGNCSEPLTAATEVIRFALTSSPKNIITFFDVAIARDIAFKFNINDDMTGRLLVSNLAAYGFIGCIEMAARQFLKRNIAHAEIVALTKAYCADTASRGESTERQLVEFARIYGDKETRAEVASRIEAFITYWNDIPSL